MASEKYPLHPILTPLNREERLQILENWQRITRYLNNLQHQLKMLAGGKEVDEILNQIETSIENAEAATEITLEVLVEVSSGLSQLSTALSNSSAAAGAANTATTQANTARDTANNAASAANMAKTNADASTSSANNATSAANAAKTAADTATSAANTARDTANNAASAANTAKDNANTATASANNAIATALQSITDINSLINNEIWRGTYSASGTYLKGNKVYYNKDSFVALKTNVGITPTNDGVNWRLVARGGIDGQGAVNTVNGLSPEENGDVILAAENISFESTNVKETLEENATNLTSLDDRLTTQLAQKAVNMTTFTEQGVAFDTSEDNHVSWVHCNVSYDESDDSFFVVYNAQPTHSVTQSKTYARKKPRNGEFSQKIVIASRLAEGISAKCQSSGIAKNGDYLAVIAHIDPNSWTNILGTYVYRSRDKGLTWDTGTKIGVNGIPIIGYSGDVSGFLTLSTGRILLWGWDMSKKSFAIYSDDNGINWFDAPIDGNPYNVTEPSFIELTDGTIIGYARDDVSDGHEHIDNPKAAWFLKSTTQGTSWEQPIKSQSILDMSNNNCAFIKHRNSELVEIVYGSRRLQQDGFGSIYQAITSQDDLKIDRWGESVRIERVNGIPAPLSGDGDSGYYGAATALDGTSLVFYYNGTKSKSKIYYLKGNHNNATVFKDKKDEQFELKGVTNKTDGEFSLGNYAAIKGDLKVLRLVGGKQLNIDLAVTSTGEAWLTFNQNVNGIDTILSLIRLTQDGKSIIDTLTATNIASTYITTPLPITIGDYGSGKGGLLFKRATTVGNVDADLAVTSTGELWLTLLSGETAINRIKLQQDGTARLNDNILSSYVSVPSSATAAGKRGYFSADANYFYVCYDTNKWMRIAKDTW